MIGRFLRSLDQLQRLDPGTPEADRARARLERLFMSAMLVGGARVANATIAALNQAGRAFELTERAGSQRVWRELLAGGERTIEVTLRASRVVREVAVIYRTVDQPRLTRRQREAHALQQTFYARYLELDREAREAGARRLRARDRLVVLIGELEADVTRGGFGEYLRRKGRRRARAALRALESIGARRTARILAAALAAATTSKRLEALDRRFSQGSEDLAVLAQRHVARR